jgi:hypothetical protein
VWILPLSGLLLIFRKILGLGHGPQPASDASIGSHSHQPGFLRNVVVVSLHPTGSPWGFSDWEQKFVACSFNLERHIREVRTPVDKC